MAKLTSADINRYISNAGYPEVKQGRGKNVEIVFDAYNYPSNEKTKIKNLMKPILDLNKKGQWSSFYEGGGNIEKKDMSWPILKYTFGAGGNVKYKLTSTDLKKVKDRDIAPFELTAPYEVIQDIIEEYGTDNTYSSKVETITTNKAKHPDTDGKWEIIKLKIFDQPITFIPSADKILEKGPDIDATTMTAMQEMASAYIFKRAIQDNQALTTVKEIKENDNGKDYEELKNIWMKVSGGKIKTLEEADTSIRGGQWLENFSAQNARLLREVSKKHFTIFTRGATKNYTEPWYVNQSREPQTFMEWVSKEVKDRFNIAKKDNWNPADVWLIKNEKKWRDYITERMKGEIKSKRQGVVEANLVEFNEIFRRLFKSQQIMGISLKKISGKTAQWKPVNVTEEFFTTLEATEFKYESAKCLCGAKQGYEEDKAYPSGKRPIGGVTEKQAASARKPRGKEGIPRSRYTQTGAFALETQETMITVKAANTTYEIQIKSNDSGKYDNLKYEPKDKATSSARLGKATGEYVDDLMEYYGLTAWKNERNWQKYPRNLEEFTGSQQKKYMKWIDELKLKGVKFGEGPRGGDITSLEAVQNIKEGFLQRSLPWVSNSKLMQITWLHYFFTLKEKNRNKLVTDMIFLAEKAGRRYGPYGKLY